MWCSILSSLLFSKVVLGVILLQDFPDDEQYDFIIAGGGTGGATVAARLAENSDFKVLVIEAGPSYVALLRASQGAYSRYPSVMKMYLKLDRQACVESYKGLVLIGTSPKYLSQGSMAGPQGIREVECLGVVARIVDGMVYTRGSKDDWNLLAQIAGDDSFSWDSILPFMLKAENLTSDSENQSEDSHIDSTIHGIDGKVFTSAAYSDHPFNDMLLQTTEERSDEFPFKLDMNDGSPIGIAWNQFTIDGNAERSSSATAYLGKSGDNVHVLVNTYVTRVLPVGNGTDFRTVEFAADAQGPTRRVTATKEVIISGGVIGTPQILLNSGIGKQEELEAIGVPTLLDNPSVGKNLTDQISALMLMETSISDTNSICSYDRDIALAQWKENRTGPMVLPNHMNHIIYVRYPDNSSLFTQEGFEDPTPGGNSPHIEFILGQISIHPPATTTDVPPIPEGITTVQFLAVNLHPVSRGSVTLNTTDLFAHPVIDFRLLTEDIDIAILREAIRSARRMYSAPVFDGLVSDSVLPPANATTDEDLDAYLRTVVSPVGHAVGTAAMSASDAIWGVVDPDFRVKGAQGLRVVDASVLPNVPSGHTQVPVYAIAELASDLIAGAWQKMIV